MRTTTMAIAETITYLNLKRHAQMVMAECENLNLEEALRQYDLVCQLAPKVKSPDRQDDVEHWIGGAQGALRLHLNVPLEELDTTREEYRHVG
jgi:hypothetical protein